jgi:hypothetical protein
MILYRKLIGTLCCKKEESNQVRKNSNECRKMANDKILNDKVCIFEVIITSKANKNHFIQLQKLISTIKKDANKQ